MEKVYCNECKYYYERNEIMTVPCKYIDGSLATIIGGTPEMCYHPVCFKKEMSTSFVTKNPPYFNVRIQGQYQLNKNRDCQNFEKIKTLKDYIKILVNKFRK